MRDVLARQIRQPDGVIFLGDGVRDADSIEGELPWYTVRGNCDLFLSDRPEEIVMALEGHVLFLSHGHRYGVKGGIGALLSRAADVDADIVMFGHTHVPMQQVIDAGSTIGGTVTKRPIYLFNPGSIGGFDGSFGTLTLNRQTVFFSHGTR